MRKLLLFALVTGLVACDTRRGGVFTPAPTVVGTYTLRTINDKPLPVTTSTIGTATEQLTSDTLALKTDGTLRRVTVYTTTDPSSSSSPTVDPVLAGGTYTVTGTTITVVAGSNTIVGTYSGGTLTLNEASTIYVYQR
jgi:hypothetical protein